MNARIFFCCIFLAFLSSCSDHNEKIIYVADAMVNCTGIEAQRCLQIKENKKDNWSNFSSNIKGFKYEVGYSYKLKIEVSKIVNPPVDAPSEQYILVEVLGKIKTPASLAKGSWLVIKIKDKITFDRNPVISLTPSQNQIHGSTSCNKFFGNIDFQNNNFKVNTIGSTKMTCQNMDTEQLFLNTLNEVAHYKIENNQLKLMSSDKSVVMVCDYMTERE